MAPDGRDFIHGLATGALAMGTGKAVARAPASADPKARPKTDRRLFGRTGRKVSVPGLGLGSAFTKPYGKERETGQMGKIGRGAVKAARRAEEQELIKGFGVTGHSSPDILMECIKRFRPDAVLTIFPASRPDKGRYEDELLPLARKHKMGVIAMKAIRRDRQSDLKGTDLIRYAMSLKGVHTTIVGLDTIAHLDENAAMATGFKPLKSRQRAAITREAQLALGNYPAPWDMPGYTDGVVV